MEVFNYVLLVANRIVYLIPFFVDFITYLQYNKSLFNGIPMSLESIYSF
jgi:hypothetical protein